MKSPWIRLAIGILVATVLLLASPAVIAARPALTKSTLLERLDRLHSDLRENPSEDDFENDLQNEFLYRLRFLVDRRYDGNEASLLRIIDFMGELENLPKNRSQSNLGPFLALVSRSLRENRESRESMISHLEKMVRQVSLVRPVDPESLGKMQDYTNRWGSMEARPFDPEALAQALDHFDSMSTQTAPKSL